MTKAATTTKTVTNGFLDCPYLRDGVDAEVRGLVELRQHLGHIPGTTPIVHSRTLVSRHITGQNQLSV